MGRYTLIQPSNKMRDMRRVRPEVAARPFPGQAGFPDERQFVNVAVVEPAPAPEPAAAPKYFRMTKVELIEAAIARGVDTSGTRAEILGRLSHG